jgi:hypothetical protein
VRWAGVCCALVAGVLLASGVSGGSLPRQAVEARCTKGSVPAVIGGKRTCLRVGQRCAKRLDRQYHRYKFHCHSGRLTRRPPVPLTPITFALQAMNSSGVTGTVTMTPENANTTRVVIDIPNPPPGTLPAHIHLGRCPDAGGIYDGLSSVVDGRSTTEVGGIAPLRRGTFSVNVHVSPSDFTVIACGDIPRV